MRPGTPATMTNAEGLSTPPILSIAKSATHRPFAPALFALDPAIGYVAVNQCGQVVEMSQRASVDTANSHESDFLEELVVNPTVLDLARRRGELDIEGVRYVLVRYGLMQQLLVPLRHGHLSVSIDLEANASSIANAV